MKIVMAGVFVWGVFLFSGVSDASEVASSADLFSAGSFGVGLTGGSTKKDVMISETEMKSEVKPTVLRISFRPHDGLLYFAKAGNARGFELTYSSGSLTNKFLGKDSGFLWGVGARWNLTQDTPVSAAIALEGSYTRTSIDVDTFKSNGNTAAVNDNFVEDEFQGAINISKRFKQLQPYGGLKVIRIVSKLKDGDTKETMTGNDNLASPFVGLQWEVFEKEFVVLEGSFLDEKNITAGMRINF